MPGAGALPRSQKKPHGCPLVRRGRRDLCQCWSSVTEREEKTTGETEGSCHGITVRLAGFGDHDLEVRQCEIRRRACPLVRPDASREGTPNPRPYDGHTHW